MDFFPLGKEMKTGKQGCLIESVNDEVRLDSVPKTHQAEGKKITGDCCKMPISNPVTAHRRREKTHVNVIAEPKRKCDVPTVPKIADISSQERPIEVFRRMNAKKIAKRDGEGAVPCEIEK